MTPTHGSIRRACAVVIGLVFFIAGMIKLMDPVGARLVVSEYLKFFHLGFLDFSSAALGVFLAFLETVTGAALVTGVFRKAAAICASLLTAIFTVITLVLWIANPSMDCGCFGEAIHLTHFQSFAKNIALCLLSAVAFIPYKDYGRPPKRKYVTFGLISAGALSVLISSSLLIPNTDFTPFSYSSRLAVAEDTNPDGEDKYISTFVYEKNGQEGSFTLDRLPDSTWTYVRTETRLRQDNIDETDYPVLSIYDRDGNYADTLAADGLVMTVSVYNPAKISDKRWSQIGDFVSNAADAGFKALVLASGVYDEVVGMLPENMPQGEKDLLESSLYIADYKTLISLNRANGGVTYFNDGNLIQRWAAIAMPDAKALAKIKSKDSTDLMLSASTKGRLHAQAPLLYSFILMLI